MAKKKATVGVLLEYKKAEITRLRQANEDLEREMVERGLALNKLAGHIKCWHDILPDEFLDKVDPIIKGYVDRSTAPSDKRQGKQKKDS
jgi:hypothetical protein